MLTESIIIGNDIIVRDQKKDERFIVTDTKDNGYLSALNFKLDGDGKPKKQIAKRVSIPINEIIGIQHTMKF